MEVRPLHPMKALPAIVVTLLGMVREVSPMQFSNANKSIFFTFSKKCTVSMVEQLLNIDVIVSQSKVTSLRLVQPSNK